MTVQFDNSLARTFYACFRESFESECEAVRARVLPLWENKKQWTEFVLNSERGLLPRIASIWATRATNEPCVPKAEWHKFDLMLVSTSAGKEWWQSVPILTLEHENDNNIQDEVWKLACWRSRLKVLITYHDSGVQAAAKLKIAAEIMSNIQQDGDGTEWLVLSAPRTWGDNLAWTAHEWQRDRWGLL